MLQVTISFFLMLVAMTYNVWLFAAVVLGRELDTSCLPSSVVRALGQVKMLMNIVTNCLCINISIIFMFILSVSPGCNPSLQQLVW